ncbi:hypothetical protein AVEN_251070-2-1, partial [Araneus ventricosus]
YSPLRSLLAIESPVRGAAIPTSQCNIFPLFEEIILRLGGEMSLLPPISQKNDFAEQEGISPCARDEGAQP